MITLPRILYSDFSPGTPVFPLKVRLNLSLLEKLVGNPTKKWAYDIQPAQAQVEQEPSVEYHVMVGLRHSTKLKIFLWCLSDTKTNNCETTSKRSFFDLHIKKDDLSLKFEEKAFLKLVGVGQPMFCKQVTKY